MALGLSMHDAKLSLRVPVKTFGSIRVSVIVLHCAGLLVRYLCSVVSTKKWRTS